ncbi:unnamed protein product [Ilex paraguariensis]|uniref:Uncharacterized protein n=1 Tax=Ilex paraguariensis TaxID=185542 RepID=A0ABC8TJS9_9AQUA
MRYGELVGRDEGEQAGVPSALGALGKLLLVPSSMGKPPLALGSSDEPSLVPGKEHTEASWARTSEH